MNAAQQTAEFAARNAYGRLLAWLVSRCQDIALAEDALGDALEAALRVWPKQGVPNNPEAWLLTVAKRKLIDQQRRMHTRENARVALEHSDIRRLQWEAAEAVETPFLERLPDRRLELLFVCAHPQIPQAMRTPLMLQTVLGMNAERIGNAMLVAPSTIGQRLVRVKRKILKDALVFQMPAPNALPERLAYVLEAIYAAYGTGWEIDPNLGDTQGGLATEAVWLARLIVQLLPEAAEAKGLYGLLCYCESRRAARRSADRQRYVPLEEQDTVLWDHTLILEGDKALWLAAQSREMGPFQTEAAIHSIHAHRAISGHTDWEAIHQMYKILVERYPSLGGIIGYAASFGRVGHPNEGLAILDGIESMQVLRHQPYWAVRAWLLAEAGQHEKGWDAYETAIGLCQDPAIREWLRAQQLRTKQGA